MVRAIVITQSRNAKNQPIYKSALQSVKQQLRLWASKNSLDTEK